MRRSWIVVVLAVAVALVPLSGVAAEDPPPFEYTTPLFGLNPDADGGLLAADSGSGIVGLDDTAELLVDLPGVADAVPSGDGDILAVTGEPPEMEGPAPEGAQTLFRVSGDDVEAVADLWAFEQAENPDSNDPAIGDENIQSNPFDLARMEDSTLVADAAGNDLLAVSDDGDVGWVAAFPSQIVTTGHLRELVDCEDPDLDPEMGFVCELPESMPAEPVPTSVALSPDGMAYVGELTGFPGTPGVSRVWQVDPTASNVVCPGEGCTEVLADQGFSAVIDVAFGADGTLYVLELDEAGFIAAEFGAGVGGTLNACDLGSGTCTELVTGAFLSTAVAVGSDGGIYTTVGALVPGQAGVRAVGIDFTDDSGSVHELDILKLAAMGITKGCNPPDNDEFCPDETTSRGEMAAFLNRALDLPPADGDAFVDDDDSIFEIDIDRFAAAGITRGCNPPDNDQFCPDDGVTRGEMAAFLNRALDLPASDQDAFVDDEGSVFEADIDAVAAAGITKGCNPPDNDEFCPEDLVTREQMASFIVRALATSG